jgi:putative serine/threonine protein kinase
LPNYERIPVTRLAGTRYARILTYPFSDEVKLRERVRELSALGISSLYFTGSALIDGVRVLGKGCVGIVTLAELDGIPVALKIRRYDADRPTMVNEGRLLRLANSVNVGPQLISVTRNMLIMQFFNGVPLFKWAESGSADNTDATREVLKDLLSSCFRLDAAGLDHGELSHAPKNVLVNRVGKACIVDFETASTTRRVANVTSLLQYFMFGRISKRVWASKIFPRKRIVLKTLGVYKREPSVENFRSILQVLRLAR